MLLTYFGGFKSKHPMRANQGPSPVSTPTPPIKTLMCTSWDSGALLVEEYEALIKAFPELNPELAERVGQRTRGRKAMYLSRKDFERHGLTDGCPRCRDISIRSGRISAHNVACRRRMENAVREADPDRWERYRLSEDRRLLRQRQATADPRALKAAALRGGSSYSYSSSSSPPSPSPPSPPSLPSPPSPSPPSAPSPQSWASNLACWVERGRKRKKDEE